MKTLTNSKNYPKSRKKFVFQLSFALIGRFSPVNIHGRLSEQFLGSQAALGTFLESQAAIGKSEQAPEEGCQKDFHN